MKARIRFYNIQHCGYYKNNRYCFGSVSEMLSDLQKWISGRTLKETLTYGVSEKNESSILETYCHSVASDEEEFLMVTWNETPSSDGRTMAIQTAVPIENAKIEVQKVPDGYTPGYPSYFWFLPGKNMFATIQFETLLNGRANLNAYLNGFLEHYSNRCRYFKTKGDEDDHVAYQDDDNGVGFYAPRFTSTVMTLPGPVDEIIRRREEIRKIIKKDVHIHERKMEPLFTFLGIPIRGKTQNASQKRSYKIEIDAEPSKSELNAIIKKWKKDVQTNPSEDIGFRLRKTKETLWLQKAVPGIEIDLAIDYEIKLGNVLFDSLTLLNALQSKREKILLIFEVNKGR